MLQRRPAPGPDASRDELVAAGEALRRRVEELEQEKRDLERDAGDRDRARATTSPRRSSQERNDLATMLEMTTEHADTVEDELHENAPRRRWCAERAAAAHDRRGDTGAGADRPPGRRRNRLRQRDDGHAVPVPARRSLVGTKTASSTSMPPTAQPLLNALEDRARVDHHEVRFRRLDGALVWVDISLRLLDFNDEPSILSALHDITERKSAEAAPAAAGRGAAPGTGGDQQGHRRSPGAPARPASRTWMPRCIERGVDPSSSPCIPFAAATASRASRRTWPRLLAASGQRVGVIDADLQSPGLHLLLGQAGKQARPHAQRLPARQLRASTSWRSTSPPHWARRVAGLLVPDAGQRQPGRDGAGAEPGLRRATADAQLPRAGRSCCSWTSCSSTPIPA